VTIIGVGNNSGYSKLQKGFDYNTLILPLKTIVKFKDKDENFIRIFLAMYMSRLEEDICPACKTKDITTNKKDKFWGCNKCGYGNWEKTLPQNQIKRQS